MASIRRWYTAYRKIGFVLLVTTCLGAILYYKNSRVSISGNSDTKADSLLKRSADKAPSRDSAVNQGDIIMAQEGQLEDEYTERLARAQDVCVSRQDEINLRELIFYFNGSSTKRNAGYCAVPKAGETFWRRIIQFINRRKKHRKVSSPFDISRYDVYWNSLANMDEARLMKFDGRLKNALRFFFVRNPYTRLISAYVDKFILPQFLDWTKYGKLFADRNTTEDEPCINDVTFSAFIEKVLKHSRFTRDAHWRPMYTLCDPCTFSPHMIGKQETFSRDAKYILRKMGLEHLMKNFSHTSDEITQMVNFAYSFREPRQYIHRCFDNVEIASRLWRAFQINGYVDSKLKFPESQIKTLLKNKENAATVKSIVTKFIKDKAGAGMSRDEHSKQKREMMVELFSTLSKDTMEKLAHRYDGDFKMFGYEKYPTDLFPWKHSVD